MIPRRPLLFLVGSTWATAVSAFQQHYNTCRRQQQPPQNLRTSSLAALSPELDTAVINIDETTPRDVGTFDEWATACGVQRSDGFQLVQTSLDYEPLDVGVMTSTDVPASSPVLFVPNQMILSANRAQEEIEAIPKAEDLLAKVGMTNQIPRFYLFLKILKEYDLGQQSPWYPWLNSLPRYFANGASMTQFCCDRLPPLVGSLATLERSRFKQFFQALDACDKLLPEECRVNTALAKWAYNIVYTRSFETGDGDYTIVPMGDMFNHDTIYEVQGSYDDAGNYYAHATYDIPAGSPLRMSYTQGDCTNPSFLFARFGFLDESSPATFCKIMLEPNQEMIDMGYDYSKMLFFKETGQVTQEVWDVLLYQILGKSESTKGDQRTLYQAHMQGDFATKQALHEQYYSKTYAALRSHVETFLTQLEDLQRKASGGDVAMHPRLPLILKHNDFVRETFLKVRENLQQ